MKKQEKIKQSDTPETDKLWNDINADDENHEFDFSIMTEHSRKLERERDEWRRSCFEITKLATESRRKLERERDEARALAEERKRYWDDVVYVWQNTEVVRAAQQSVKEGAK